MAKVTPILTNFTAGEVSPLLDGRTDIASYYNSAKTLENFIILPQGGLKRRPGTYYVSTVKDSAKKVRLIPFQFSSSQAYTIEFGDRYCRFYANHGQLLSGASAYEITSPYLEADLFDLQFAQDADTMWITHPSYKTRKLTRASAAFDAYTKLIIHFDGTDGSKADYTAETAQTVSMGTTLSNDAQLDTAKYKFGGASLLLDGTDDYISVPDSEDWFFDSGDFSIDLWVNFGASIPAAMVGLLGQYEDTDNYWAFRYNGNGSNLELSVYSSASEIISVASGNWSPSTNTWYHIELTRNGNNFYFFIDGVQSGSTGSDTSAIPDFAAALFIGRHTHWTGTSYYFSGWMDEIRVSKGIARHTANFTAPTSAYTADGAVTFSIDNYAPTADPFGADGSDDCPSCVTIHEQRIFFANTNNDPQTVWSSKSGDYENMTTGANDADALEYTIGSEQVNAIRWLSSGRVLGMGTLGGVFSLSSGADAAAVTPTNITVKRETTYGTISIVPKKIGNFVYYVQRNAKTIREFGYSYDIDEYASFDMMLLAEHISGEGIIDMDYQQSPYNILWCVRSDGVLSCMTRQIDQKVLAWSRMILGGSYSGGDAVVESVSVIPGDGGDDEVWISVKRTINSSTVRYIEYFKPIDYGTEQEDGFFVDCGLTLDNPKPITDITSADPGVVTAIGHNFSNGDIVIIRGVVGMTELNRTKFKVANITEDTFELTDPDDDTNIDTSSYTTYVSGGEVRKCVTTLSGLSHLEGETIDLFIDGYDAITAEVSSGAVTIPSANKGGEIHAGLRYTPYFQSMRIEAGSQLGTAQTKKKRVNKVFIRVYKSLMMKAGNTNTQDEFNFRDAGDSTDNPIELYSGDQEVMMPGIWDKDGYIVITQDGPYPLNIIAIVVHLSVSDD